MQQIRRKKLIKEGNSNAEIEKIESMTNKNGYNFYKFSVRRKSDNAKRDFWISEESYLIDKLIDLFFKDDPRETFELDEFIGKEIGIVVEISENGFYNITDIKSTEELIEEEHDEDQEEEDLSLEKDLFEEDDLFDEEDEFGELDL